MIEKIEVIKKGKHEYEIVLYRDSGWPTELRKETGGPRTLRQAMRWVRKVLEEDNRVKDIEVYTFQISR